MKRFWSRKGTYKDVDSILAKISDVTKAEMDALGVDRWKAYGRAKACKGAGTLTAIMDGMDVAALFGAVKLPGKNVHATWFIASQQYFDGGIGALRISIEEVKRLKAHTETELQSATLSKEKHVHKWFKSLGFDMVYVQDGMYVFKYAGRPARKPVGGDLPSDVCY